MRTSAWRIEKSGCAGTATPNTPSNAAITAFSSPFRWLLLRASAIGRRRERLKQCPITLETVQKVGREPGATHEISLACRALTYDDAPSRLRGAEHVDREAGAVFGAVEDPRCSGKVEHRLVEMLVIAVCAVIACAESWDDIALYGRSKLAWLRTFLELPNGIPSHDTFRRVFMLIDPEAFEAGFAAWAGALTAGFEREVVAIDGKTIRRSFDHGRSSRRCTW